MAPVYGDVSRVLPFFMFLLLFVLLFSQLHAVSISYNRETLLSIRARLLEGFVGENGACDPLFQPPLLLPAASEVCFSWCKQRSRRKQRRRKRGKRGGLLLRLRVQCDRRADPNAPKECCFSFYTRPIPVAHITQYEETNPDCTRAGVIFTTKRGPVCVDPGFRWVKRAMDKIDRRTVEGSN
ncbi:hypothetical protein SRHO_G00031590 [Serrasalmus rhombeus]